MIKRNINIAILEPSYLIFEGLATFLGKNIGNCHIERAESLNDLMQVSLRRPIDLVMVNPGHILQNGKTLQSVRGEMGSAKWIGLVYSFYDPQLLLQFDGNIYINDSPKVISELIERLAREEENSDQPQHQEALSQRETEVLKLLAKGLANKEIADKLNISIHTVISHRKNITLKTGIKSVSGLTIFAVINGLVNLGELSD